MRVALITDGGFPFERRDGGAWCERLVRGLASHEFEVYALASPEGGVDGDGGGGAGRPRLPSNVTGVHVLPPPTDGRTGKRAGRRSRTLVRYRELVRVLAQRPEAGGGAPPVDRFADALYGLAEAAREEGTPPGMPQSEAALRALEDACRAPGAGPLLGTIRVPGLITAAELLAQALRPLSAPWYGSLGAADLCHATSGGGAVLPGLLGKRFSGIPLLVTEYGVQLRETLLAHQAVGHPPHVRALLTAFHRLLAGEAYRQAAIITAGNAHARRWQERCGAERARIRTVNPGYPGLADLPVPPASAGSAAGSVAGATGGGRPPTLLWTGTPEPTKDLFGLLHAFAEVRKAEPGARLRLALRGGGSAGYLAHCRQLAVHLFPDEAASAVSVGENPVSFETWAGGPGEMFAADVVVLSSVVEGFPHSLVEAMFAERATVSTDVGAVREVIGGTGLVVPPRNPRGMAAACTALLRDPERRDRLGAAARERALELFTVEQNVRAFREIYLGVVAQSPVKVPVGAAAAVPFARTAESQATGRCTTVPSRAAARLQEDLA